MDPSEVGVSAGSPKLLQADHNLTGNTYLHSCLIEVWQNAHFHNNYNVFCFFLQIIYIRLVKKVNIPFIRITLFNSMVFSCIIK